MKRTAICSPDWFNKSAIYQINPRTFSKEGTIQAITDEIPFLKDLGFRILYLCPIFEADESLDNRSPRQLASKTDNPKNPYRMNDYFSIDNEYGTMDDLRVLVKKAHEAGLYVLLDLVYAHIGNSADIIKRHPEFVMQNQDGSFVCSEWNFPKFDFNNEGLREYLYCNMVYYISVIDVDGFRCDVGDGIPIDFWNEAKKRITRVKSDAVLINEGRKYYYMETAFDACYCFAWHECVRKVFCGTDSASKIKELYENLDLQKGGKLLRDIDKHDTVTDWLGRTETVCGHNGMEQIEVINYLIDGIPMVYAGNELACEAELSMFANRFFPGRYEVTKRNDKYSDASKRRQEVIRILNKLKAEQDILYLGKTVWTETSMPNEVICFKRGLDGEEIMFIGNAKSFAVDIDITIPEERKCVLTNRKNLQSSGKLCLGPYEYAVFMQVCRLQFYATSTEKSTCGRKCFFQFYSPPGE